LKLLGADFNGATLMALEAGKHLSLWLALAGIVTAWFFNLLKPELAEQLKKRLAWGYTIIVSKYGFDDFNQIVFVRGARALGDFFYRVSDLILIDGIFVNGTGRLIRWFSLTARQIQSGYIYHYTFAMITGLLVFLGWLMLGS
jgi:NADH-quinone oxidoreductase subunit L